MLAVSGARCARRPAGPSYSQSRGGRRPGSIGRRCGSRARPAHDRPRWDRRARETLATPRTDRHAAASAIFVAAKPCSCNNVRETAGARQVHAEGSSSRRPPRPVWMRRQTTDRNQLNARHSAAVGTGRQDHGRPWRARKKPVGNATNAVRRQSEAIRGHHLLCRACRVRWLVQCGRSRLNYDGSADTRESRPRENNQPYAKAYTTPDQTRPQAAGASLRSNVK